MFMCLLWPLERERLVQIQCPHVSLQLVSSCGFSVALNLSVKSCCVRTGEGMQTMLVGRIALMSTHRLLPSKEAEDQPPRKEILKSSFPCPWLALPHGSIKDDQPGTQTQVRLVVLIPCWIHIVVDLLLFLKTLPRSCFKSPLFQCWCWARSRVQWRCRSALCLPDASARIALHILDDDSHIWMPCLQSSRRTCLTSEQVRWEMRIVAVAVVVVINKTAPVWCNPGCCLYLMFWSWTQASLPFSLQYCLQAMSQRQFWHKAVWSLCVPEGAWSATKRKLKSFPMRPLVPCAALFWKWTCKSSLEEPCDDIARWHSGIHPQHECPKAKQGSHPLWSFSLTGRNHHPTQRLRQPLHMPKFPQSLLALVQHSYGPKLASHGQYRWGHICI